jgi:MFS family permease
MSINGFTVLLIQVKLTRLSEKYSVLSRIVAGAVLFALGEVGFALSTAWAGFILSMIVFTLGEILIIPAEYAQIDQITPHGMRGTYYGAQSLSELGNFLGPWAGGLVLSSMGGKTMFLTLSVVSLVSLIFYWKGCKKYENRG